MVGVGYRKRGDLSPLEQQSAHKPNTLTFYKNLPVLIIGRFISMSNKLNFSFMAALNDVQCPPVVDYFVLPTR